ncbi:MAG: hypothetical protein QM523_05410 [Candidatus Pacebacteria bacterium]|nr:hypothetical protein [Candidatus Paceibacterota bacterium]
MNLLKYLTLDQPQRDLVAGICSTFFSASVIALAPFIAGRLDLKWWEVAALLTIAVIFFIFAMFFKKARL